MRYRISTYVFLILSALFYYSTAKAQPLPCPPNLDFEDGDFQSWNCRVGTLDMAGNISWAASTNAIPGRHTIIPTATAGTDFYGGFQRNCPNGSKFTALLGNTNSPPGKQASEITYTYTIPPATPVFSILFWYAIVLHDPPSNHTLIERPRFKARIFNVTDNISLPCVDFDFISSASLPGFRTSTVNPEVVYKDWTPITLNLSNLAGKTIQLEFTTMDCTRGGHFSYAYVDVNSFCNGVISGNYICPNSSAITLTAPFGFDKYTWYSDITFTTILSLNQTLVLNPPPAVGTIFPVVVEPFAGFGCKDTLYAVIDVATPPVSKAGPDKTICQGGSVQIGAPQQPGFDYSWTPVAEVSNATIADPLAQPLTSNPTEYIVLTTDQFTGCSSTDTTWVTTSSMDTTMIYAGDNEICIGEPGPTLSVNGASTSVQWYDQTTGAIPGATGITFNPTVTGDYWAQIIQGSCLDSTRTEKFTVHPLPLPSYTLDNDTACMKLDPFEFDNTSTSPDGANMLYRWTFSDGDIQTSTDVDKIFTNAGTYTVKMQATTQFGCIDSTAGETLYVLPSGVPNFTWDSICVGKPVHFQNLSNENGSVQSNYTWDFNNGGPPFTFKNPFPVFYNIPPGQVDVTLKMTTLGCENDTQTLVRKVQVNKQVPGHTYQTLTVPQGSSKFIHVRDSVGNIYNWRPPIRLSSYSTRYTEFFATGDDVKYLIDITDIHTCITTDTMQMLVLKKTGFYLPTAFTPNDDGLNDMVRPYLIGMKGLISFSIYNRWGNLLFNSKTYGEGWDGKRKGEKQNAGVYVWVLEFYDSNNKHVIEKGYLTLIR